METHLAEFIRDTRDGREAEEILRRCVHCGFCTATCPTYQLLGDELDGPRGRIYLIKQALEGAPVSAKTLRHLDRCLLCRSCETTCPSGVHYSRLLEIGRRVVAARVGRPPIAQLARAVVRESLSRSFVFSPALKSAQLLRPLLPRALQAKVPPLASAGAPPRKAGQRRMLLLAGCVQPAMFPGINGAAQRLFARLGLELVTVPGAGCCGALRLHLEDEEGAQRDARRNIDAWWPAIEAGAEAIVATASACALQLKDYGRLLADDPRYAEKAARVAALARDVSEVAMAERNSLLALFSGKEATGRLAFHSPCTLQHGLKVRGAIEELLTAAGYTLTPVADAHLCCGSAGAYSLLQPEIARRLRANKLAALMEGKPQGIASANVGCIAYLMTDACIPVRHWVEWLEQTLCE